MAESKKKTEAPEKKPRPAKSAAKDAATASEAAGTSTAVSTEPKPAKKTPPKAKKEEASAPVVAENLSLSGDNIELPKIVKPKGAKTFITALRTFWPHLITRLLPLPI